MNTQKKKFISVNLFAIISIITAYIFFDKTIALWIYVNLKGTHLYFVAEHLSKVFSTGNIFIFALLLVIIASVFFIIKLKKHAMRFFFIASCFFITLSIALILKFTLARYRPELFFTDNLFGFHFFSLKKSYNSFPSGHTISCFSIALSSFCIVEKRWISWSILIIAISVACSRIILTAHYFSDVFGGIYLAALVTFFMSKIYFRVKEKYY